MLILRDIFSEVALHSSYLKIDGKAVVSTFAGEASLFGHSDLDKAWTYVKNVLSEVVPVSKVKFIRYFLTSKSALRSLLYPLFLSSQRVIRI